MIPGIAIFHWRVPVRLVGVNLDLNCVGQRQDGVGSSGNTKFGWKNILKIVYVSVSVCSPG